MSNFFKELKKRKVVKAIISYGVIVFILFQLVEILFPIFELPIWASKFVILLLLLGFPIVFFISWFFDFSRDEMKINEEVDSLKKIRKDSDTTISTRLKHQITSVAGDSSQKAIRDFVDNYLLARDARALREHVKTINPDLDLTFFPQGTSKRVSIPIGLTLFWPDSE